MNTTHRSGTSAEDAVLRTAPGRNPAGAVYGTVIAGSLIATQSATDSDLFRLVLVVVVTLVVYWLAHVYAELVGRRVRDGRQQSWSEIRRLLKDEYAIVSASCTPLLVILTTSAVGATEQTAVLIGLWSIPVLLGAWAIVAGRRSRLSGLELVIHAGAGTAFGCAIVLLKILLH